MSANAVNLQRGRWIWVKVISPRASPNVERVFTAGRDNIIPFSPQSCPGPPGLGPRLPEADYPSPQSCGSSVAKTPKMYISFAFFFMVRLGGSIEIKTTKQNDSPKRYKENNGAKQNAKSVGSPRTIENRWETSENDVNWVWALLGPFLFRQNSVCFFYGSLNYQLSCLLNCLLNCPWICSLDSNEHCRKRSFCGLVMMVIQNVAV